MKIKKAPITGLLPLAAVSTLLLAGTASAQCPSTLTYDHGYPNGCRGFASSEGFDYAGGGVPDDPEIITADDFILPGVGTTTVNDIHWYVEEEDAGDSNGTVVVKIFENAGTEPGAELQSYRFGVGAPDGGQLTRTELGPGSFAGFTRVRYDLTKIEFEVDNGVQQWLGLQPVLTFPANGRSFWVSSRCTDLGDVIDLNPALTNGEAVGGVWTNLAAPEGADMNWQFSTCIPGGGTPCVADFAMDDGGPACGSDGTTDTFDLLQLLSEWNTAGTCADIAMDDGGPAPGSDGIVDTFDLLLLLADWNCVAEGGSGSNDDCENAQLIIGQGAFDFDLTGATPDGPMDACDGAADVWFCLKNECVNFPFGDPGQITFSSAAAVNIAVYDVNGTICSDGLGGLIACGNPVTAMVQEGSHYKIRISGAEGVAGSFDAVCEAPPANNDICAEPTLITTGQLVSGDLSVASPDNTADCGGGLTDGAGVWFSIVGTGKQLAADTCQLGTAASVDTRVQVYCNDCALLNCVAGNDQPVACAFGDGDSAIATWCSEAGRLYRILVHAAPGTEGPFELVVTEGSNCVVEGQGGCFDDAFECNIVDQANCQLPNQAGNGPSGIIATVSDTSFVAGALAVADNFVPSANGTVSELCWWGIWADPGNGFAECTPLATNNFTIRFLGSDAEGLPDGSNVLGTYTATSAGGTLSTGPTGLLVAGRNEIGFSTVLDPPLAVTAGECVWVEIQNDAGGSSCNFVWTTAPGNTPDTRSYTDGPTADGTYVFAEVNDFNVAFCVGDVAIEADTETTCPLIIPAPANDECADAIALTVPSVTPTDNRQATASPEAIACDDSGMTSVGTGLGIWYTVVGDGTTYTADACTNADYDGALHVYCSTDDTCGNFGCVIAGDDECGAGSHAIVSWCTEVGKTYYIYVGAFPNAGDGVGGLADLTLSSDGVACAGAPTCEPEMLAVGDLCSDPIDATANINGASITGDSSDYTSSVGDPNFTCNVLGSQPGTNTIWYSVTFGGGDLTAATCASAGAPMVDTILAIRSGACGALVEEACDDDACADPNYYSTVTATGLAAGTYLIEYAQNGGWGGSTPGPFVLDITSP